MRTRIFLLLNIFICTTSLVSAGTLYAPPSRLENTSSEMQTPGFWITRHPDPDRVILTPKQINALNRHIIEDLKLAADLPNWPEEYPGRDLARTLNAIVTGLEEDGLVFLDGLAIADEYWQSVRESLNFEAIPSRIPRRYGVTVRYTDQRLLPTEQGLYAEAGDIDFDELQNSALDIGTPVIILHESLDGRWVFVRSAISDGWVKKDDVAFVPDDDIGEFFSGRFVVVTVPKADVYGGPGRKKAYGAARMGARLPLAAEHPGVKEVAIPFRGKNGEVQFRPGFVDESDVHEGYLAYTPRAVIRQAFKMLHQPYGWGGMYGAQDCSRFLHQVFSTVGIQLPRNSGDQIRAGELLASWDANAEDVQKLSALRERGIGGITVLGMKGHIMVYLGSLEDRAYAIHAIWAYRRPVQDAPDEIVVLNRVVVSDLSLGEGSKKGSLLNRLHTVRVLR